MQSVRLMLASESLGKKSVALGVLATNEQHPSDEHCFGLRVCSNCEAKTIKTIQNHQKPLVSGTSGPLSNKNFKTLLSTASSMSQFMNGRGDQHVDVRCNQLQWTKIDGSKDRSIALINSTGYSKCQESIRVLAFLRIFKV